MSCSGVSVTLVVQTPLPWLVSVSGNTIGPATPRGATWIWASVPTMSVVTIDARIARVVELTTTTPVPAPALLTGGASCAPLSVAENTFCGTVLLTVFTWLIVEAFGLIGLSSLPQPAIASMDSVAIHHGAKRRE